MIRIAGLRDLSDRLARLDMTESQHTALDAAARLLQEALQEALSTPSGGDHTKPWRRTGSLQASMGYRSDSTSATVGSDDPIAINQEFGTPSIPPRPFLAPVAAAHAAELARQVGGSIATAVRDAIKGSIS